MPLAPAGSTSEADCLRQAWADVTTPSGLAELHESWRRVEEALEKLSEDQREVILLAYIVQMPRAEIARKLGRTDLAVRLLLHRALARLSLLVGSEG